MTHLQKIINLIKKTGDKVIVLDENGEPNYVLMTVSDYERLNLGKSGVKGLTEDELLAKINRDITIWKDTQEIEELPIDQYDFSQDLGNFSEFNEEESRFHDFEPIGDIIDGMDFEDDENESNFDQIPREKEEDRYYFEPVE